MKNLIVISIAIALLSCHNGRNNANAKIVKVDKNSSSSKSAILQSKLIKNFSNNIAEGLLGVWILKGTSNPAFIIKKNSIYYPEHFKIYKYRISNDSIQIAYEGYNASFAYKFIGTDTLILNSYDYGKTIYYRNH